MKKYYKLIQDFSIWRLNRFSEHKILLLLSFVVGLVSGFAAVLLKNLIHILGKFLTRDFTTYAENYQYLAYPGIGILITVLYVRFFVKDDIGHGITKILKSIANNKGLLRVHNMFTSIISSTITIGFGGSVGAEAPVVLTGSSIGSNIARTFHLSYRSMTVLIGCGAAGAIAGIFKAPLAGVLFAIEVLMLDLTMASLLPLMISAATAASLAFFLMGNAHHFEFQIIKEFNLANIPWYIVLGIFCGLFSFLFTRGNIFVEGSFKKIQNTYLRVMIGGILLGIMVFLFPSLWGEGYLSIEQILTDAGSSILNNSLFVEFKDDQLILFGLVLLIMLVKIVATAATNGAGGSGGIFAPTLFLGGLGGFFVSSLLNYAGKEVPVRNFALAGMAGMMSGVMHAPMTAIFLIAEITGGFGLLIPLMITAAVAFLTITPLEPHSIYHKRLARDGELITHNKDKAVLTLLKLNNLIETDLLTVRIDNTLGDLVQIISKSKRNIFPVIEGDNKFCGIVLLDDIRPVMFDEERYNVTLVKDLMVMPPAIISPNEKMESVMQKFHESEAWNLPVVNNQKYIGCISKSTIFNAYRTELVHFSEE
ncbi:MAG: chloride channel protein [Prolixibacteraceae bacterium]|jgi:CIC family chloride channel protein|nr:chloride channel protein [Prolixibacteraceae bacterium]